MDARRGAAIALVFGGLLTMNIGQASGEPEQRRETSTTLLVEITGFRNERGNAKVALWRSREGFPADERRAVKRFKVPIVAGCAKLTVEGLEPGPWAVAAFHDENDNGKIRARLPGHPQGRTGRVAQREGELRPAELRGRQAGVRPR
ncbi:MAG: DUF2141 domain-containing protein [Myxococcales bacterium]